MRVVCKDRFPQLGERHIGRVVGKHLRGPRRSGAGHDGPVDLVARDQFERRPIGLRDGAIGAAHFVGIFIREQRRDSHR